MVKNSFSSDILCQVCELSKTLDTTSFSQNMNSDRETFVLKCVLFSTMFSDISVFNIVNWCITTLGEEFFWYTLK